MNIKAPTPTPTPAVANRLHHIKRAADALSEPIWNETKLKDAIELAEFHLNKAKMG